MITTRAVLTQFWGSLSNDKKDALRDAYKQYKQDDTQSTQSTSQAEPVPTEPVAKTDTTATSGGTDTVVKLVTNTADQLAERQPEVASDPVTSTDDVVGQLASSLKDAAPEVVEKAVKLVEEVKALVQPADPEPAQQFPRYDAEADAGKVDATDYARRAAIAAQAKAQQMSLLDSLGADQGDSFAPVLKASSYGGGSAADQPRTKPVDLTV
ncbi:hypothetical protein [Pseudooceanicola sp. MF1-13]|uniref:hypothetical protein n=1 Tax=Pseudooceanicola sp. MF1-13 TaxID=3379095 RepID=UPI00389220C1